MPHQCQRFQNSTQAVLFDIEGVLVDSECAATTAAMIDVFSRRDVAITEEDARVKPCVQSGANQTQLRNDLRAVMQHVSDKWEAAKSAAPTEWDLEAMFKEMPQAVADQMKVAKVAGGALEIVSGLRAKGVKIGGTTEFDESVTPAWTRHALAEGLEIQESLSAAEAAVGTSKGAPPLPWRAVALAANLEVFPNSACIRVTNRVYGVQEGLNAGMWTIGVCAGGACAGDLAEAGAHYVIEDVGGFDCIFGEIQLRMRMGDKP